MLREMLEQYQAEANLRLRAVASLPNLGLSSGEAYHTYGREIGERHKRVRQTVDHLHEKTNVIAVVNTTAPPTMSASACATSWSCAWARRSPSPPGWRSTTRTARSTRLRVTSCAPTGKYGKFFVHQPARAQVDVRREGGRIVVEIEGFISPTVVERPEMDMRFFRANITDWRAMVDCVIIDLD